MDSKHSHTSLAGCCPPVPTWKNEFCQASGCAAGNGYNTVTTPEIASWVVIGMVLELMKWKYRLPVPEGIVQR